MPGPNPTFSPRTIFNDPNWEGDAFLKGLGDANVSPVADIAEGLDKGIRTGANVAALIDEYGPVGQERKQLQLETERANAERARKQAVIQDVEYQATVQNQDAIIANRTAEIQEQRLAHRNTATQAKLYSDAMAGLYQIQDAESFTKFVQDPRFAPLRADPKYAQIISGTAVAMLGTTSDPIQQINLVRAAEAASPGSQDKLLKLLPTATQALLQSPVDEARAAKLNGTTANQVPPQPSTYDPAKEALEASGLLKPYQQPSAGAPDTFAAPTRPLGVPDPSGARMQDVAQPTEYPLNPQAGVGAPDTTIGAPNQSPKESPAVQAALQAEKNQPWVQRFLEGAPEYPQKKWNAIYNDIKAQNPQMKDSDIIKAAQAQLKVSTFQPKEIEERNKFRDNLSAMKVTAQRVESALDVVQDTIKENRNVTMGAGQTVARTWEQLEANLTDDQKRDLRNAKAELDSVGFIQALQMLTSMHLGRVDTLANTNEERQGLQRLFTGENTSYEKNVQALEILKAKIKEAEDVSSIVDVYQRLGYNYDQATQAADLYRRTNPGTVIDVLNGTPIVKRAQQGSTVDQWLFQTLNLDKYMQRDDSGRVVGNQPADPYKLAPKISEEIQNKSQSGTTGPKFTVGGENVNDIPDGKEIPEKSPGGVGEKLLRRMSFFESSNNPNAQSPKDAKGLMQLMDDTGKEIWKELGFEGEYDPYDTEKNLIMGASYMNKLLPWFNNDTRLALAAYNAGPGTISKAMEKAEQYLGDTSWASVKHYLPEAARKETIPYVQRIMGDDEKASGPARPTKAELPGLYSSLPTQKAQLGASTGLTPDGQAALKQVADIKTVDAAQGTILEDALNALLTLNPFEASTAQAEEPDNSEPLASGDSFAVGSKQLSASEEDDIKKTINGESPNVEDTDPLRYPRVATTKEEQELLAKDFRKEPPGLRKEELLRSINRNPNSLEVYDGMGSASSSDPSTVTGIKGQTDLGNIPNLFNRPKLQNQDEAASATLSMSFQDSDGKEVLIPTVVEGKKLSDKQAIENYKKTGQFLGKFETPAAANQYAEMLHAEQEKRLGQESVYQKYQGPPGDLTEDEFSATNAEADTGQSKPKQAAENPDAGLTGAIEAFAVGTTKGLLFGGDDELFALLRSKIHGTPYEQELETTRQISDTLRAAHPTLFLAGDVYGGASGMGKIGKIFSKVKGATTAAKEVNKVGQLAKELTKGSLGNLGKTAIKGALAGGAAAGARGFGDAEGGFASRKDNFLKQGSVGAILGAVLGPVAERITSRFTKGALPDFTDEEKEVIRLARGISNEELDNAMTEMSKAGSEAASLIEQLPPNQRKAVIDYIAKNPDAIGEAAATAEGMLNAQGKAVDAALSDVSIVKDSDKAAKDLQSLLTSKLKAFKKAVQDKGDEVYGAAREASEENSVLSKSRYSKFRFAKPASEEKVMLVDAKGKTIETDALVQRYRPQGAVPSKLSPAFNSEEVYQTVDRNPVIQDAIKEAYAELKGSENLQPNDFRILTKAKSILGDWSKDLSGANRKLAGSAKEELEKALYKENPLLAEADKAYEEAYTKLASQAGKGVQKLLKYTGKEGAVDSSKIHKDLLSLGETELKTFIGELNASERETLKTSVSAYIKDSLAARGERNAKTAQKFVDFTKKGMAEKIKIIFGKEDGTALLKNLKAIERTTDTANAILRAGKSSAEKLAKEGARVERSFTRDAVELGLAGAGFAAYPHPYTGLLLGMKTVDAFTSFFKAKGFTNEQELARGVYNLVLQDPEQGLELVRKMSGYIADKHPALVPLWARVSTSVANAYLGRSTDNRLEARKARQDAKAKRMEIYINQGDDRDWSTE